MLEPALASFNRLFGKPRGWERVVRLLSPPGKGNGQKPYPVKVSDGYVFPVDRGTLLGWYVHFFGTYEPEVQEQMKKILYPGSISMDVGANVGWHTLLMAQLAGPGGKVYAFEPNPSTRERLAGAVRENTFSQVHVDERALADYEGISVFKAPLAGDLWDGTGYLVKVPAPAEQSVKCTTLDRFREEYRICRLDLIKIDVEGWELSVLRGATKTLEFLRPQILFEYDPAYVFRCGGNGKDIVNLLSHFHYDLFALRPRGQSIRINHLADTCGNFLAIPVGCSVQIEAENRVAQRA